MLVPGTKNNLLPPGLEDGPSSGGNVYLWQGEPGSSVTADGTNDTDLGYPIPKYDKTDKSGYWVWRLASGWPSSPLPAGEYTLSLFVRSIDKGALNVILYAGSDASNQKHLKTVRVGDAHGWQRVYATFYYRGTGTMMFSALAGPNWAAGKTVPPALPMINRGRTPAPWVPGVGPTGADTLEDRVPVVLYGTTAPTTGKYKVGDRKINTAWSPGGILEWRCTAAGTPGTWTPIRGEIQSAVAETERQFLAGILGAGFDWFVDPMVRLDDKTPSTSSGGVAPAFIGGALVQLDSGITSGNSRLTWGPDINANPIIPGGSSGEWAVVARIRIPTAVDANTSCVFGFRTGAGILWAGVRGSQSTTKWSAIADGVGMTFSGTSGPNIDTNWHTLALVRKASVTTLYVDGVAVGSANIYPSIPVGLNLDVTDFGANASRQMQIQWIGVMFPRS